MIAERKIVLTKKALAQFDNAIEYIRRDSPQNTEKVREAILKKVGELTDNKIVHRKDPYKENNDGNYLYFETMKYRIVYYATPKEVFIIRVRHTAMEPGKY